MLLTSMICISLPSFAIWFEASGQAVVIKGDKPAARERATQEALKQALLFAGASVSSVQTMANGLLEQDNFEVRSSGEVQSIELIDEIYQGDIVTVSIRADIFPQTNQCSASDYKKSIVTAWFPIVKRQQASAGNLYGFGKTLANRLKLTSVTHAKYSIIDSVHPLYINSVGQNAQSQAMQLARLTNSQFVLLAQIDEFGVEQQSGSRIKFWKEPKVDRNLTLDVSLYDGISGERVMQKVLAINTPWQFNLHKSINPDSQALWQSHFGLASQDLLETIQEQVDKTVSCLPAYGRIINITSEQLTINLGKMHGVKQGDTLTLFQMKQVIDNHHQSFVQYSLHPEKVVVTQVFPDTAQLKSENGAPLANIQPNDFVARR